MIRSELAELSAFATVAEERSFTRAASRLGISQSALSHSVRGLEKRLGLQLLARTTRRVSPTAAGTALLQELAPALERIARAVAETRKQRGKSCRSNSAHHSSNSDPDGDSAEASSIQSHLSGNHLGDHFIQRPCRPRRGGV